MKQVNKIKDSVVIFEKKSGGLHVSSKKTSRKFDVSRSLAAIFVASTLFACTQEVINEVPAQAKNEVEAMTALPKYRTYEEALAVAQEAIGMLGESSVTRSGKPRTVSTDDVQYIMNTSSTRSDEEPDTLMYVFNYEDNAGFAVVSANRATEELIAVTEQGNYVAGEETGNGGFDLYMNMAQEYVRLVKPPLKDSIDNGMEEFTQIREEYDIDTISYGPYLQVRWGQYWPYNRFCYITSEQKAPAGCVATAIAQIMSYYKNPNSMVIDYDGNSETLQLDWNMINGHKYSSIRHDYQSPCPCSSSYSHAHVNIGKLFRQIGKLVAMNYAATESDAHSFNVALALLNLGYTYGEYQNYSVDIVKNSLRQSQLVYMRGEDVVTEKGHAWVIDGFRTLIETFVVYVKPDSQLFWEILKEDTSTYQYCHINWGWDGDSNGYFSAGIFDTQRYTELDSGMSNEYEYDYERNLKIYPYIRKNI